MEKISPNQYKIDKRSTFSLTGKRCEQAVYKNN